MVVFKVQGVASIRDLRKCRSLEFCIAQLSDAPPGLGVWASLLATCVAPTLLLGMYVLRHEFVARRRINWPNIFVQTEIKIKIEAN